MKKNKQIISKKMYLMGLVLLVLVVNISIENAVANMSQDSWIEFSLSSNNTNSVNIFQSNDTYGYNLTIQVNITSLLNSSIHLYHQNGDTFESNEMTSLGNYSYNIATMSAFLDLETLQSVGNATGYYKLIIGERVSLSPYADMNLLVILGFFSLGILNSIGIPPMVSAITIIGIYLTILALDFSMLFVSARKWRKGSASDRMIFVSLLVLSAISTVILLWPFRFSFF